MLLGRASAATSPRSSPSAIPDTVAGLCCSRPRSVFARRWEQRLGPTRWRAGAARARCRCSTTAGPRGEAVRRCSTTPRSTSRSPTRSVRRSRSPAAATSRCRSTPSSPPARAQRRELVVLDAGHELTEALDSMAPDASVSASFRRGAGVGTPRFLSAPAAPMHRIGSISAAPRSRASSPPTTERSSSGAACRPSDRGYDHILDRVTALVRELLPCPDVARSASRAGRRVARRPDEEPNDDVPQRTPGARGPGARIGLPIRMENDANCLALAEAVAGAGRGHELVFGVILGIGSRRRHRVPRRGLARTRNIAGEWGHHVIDPGGTALLLRPARLRRDAAVGTGAGGRVPRRGRSPAGGREQRSPRASGERSRRA